MSCVDVSLLGQFSAETLCALLRQVQGQKDLVIYDDIMKPIDKFAGMTLLRNCGVKKVYKMSQFDPVVHGSAAAGASPNRIYLAEATLNTAKQIIDQVKISSASNVVIVFVPKILQSVLILLEEEGMIDKVHVCEYMWQLIPLDADLLNLELPNFLDTTIGQEDFSLLSCVSKSLFGVESLFGGIPNRIALGKRSDAVLTQLQVLESQKADWNKSASTISHLVLIDRDFDLVSFLLSPVTYEALLDEVFGISCGTIDFSKFQPSGGEPKNEKLASAKLELSTKDKVFESIRFKHFSSIFSVLSTSAKQIRQSQSQANNMNVTQMREFVEKNLKDLQQQSKAVAVHIGASEIIQKEKGQFYEELLPLEHLLVKGSGYKDALNFLEQAMSRLYPPEVVLRLLCLTSCCSNGLSNSDYNKMKKLFCHAYGFKHVATFMKLHSLNMLTNKDGPGNNVSFSNLSSKLELVTRSSKTPPSTSAVFNGVYTPVVCKIVQQLLESPNLVSDFCKSFPSHTTLQLNSSTSAKNILVYFVGGYTLAETAALKALQATTSSNFLLAGTSNVTGKSFMKMIIGSH